VPVRCSSGDFGAADTTGAAMRVTFRPTAIAFSDDDGIVVIAGGADPTLEVWAAST
jgi:hypothetical protein